MITTDKTSYTSYGDQIITAKVEHSGTTQAVKSSERPLITVIDSSKITPSPTGTPALSRTMEQKTAPAPVQVTPGLDIMLAIIVLAVTVLAIIVLVFAAVFRRR